MTTSARTHAAFLEAILAYVEESAGSRAGRLSQTSGPPEAPVTPRRALDLGSIAALLETAARMLEDDAIGLHFAAGFDFDALGLFSFAVLQAPTVGTALRNMERYSGAVVAGVHLRLDVDDREASIAFPVWGDGAASGYRQVDEAALLFVLRMLRRMAGPGWAPDEIAFRHPAPDDLDPHRRLLKCRLRFDQTSSRIRFSRRDLDRSVRGVDRLRLPIVEGHLADVASAEADSDADADPWRHALKLQIASLVCDGHPSIRTIAPRLGMSARTLQRRLDERGLCYRDLVAGVRLQIARHYLEASHVETSLGEIAFVLGYSELSAFDRAFRRWKGMSPGEYRRRSAGRKAPSTAALR